MENIKKIKKFKNENPIYKQFITSKDEMKKVKKWIKKRKNKCKW